MIYGVSYVRVPSAPHISYDVKLSDGKANAGNLLPRRHRPPGIDPASRPILAGESCAARNIRSQPTATPDLFVVLVQLQRPPRRADSGKCRSRMWPDVRDVLHLFCYRTADSAVSVGQLPGCFRHCVIIFRLRTVGAEMFSFVLSSVQRWLWCGLICKIWKNTFIIFSFKMIKRLIILFYFWMIRIKGY